MLSSAEEPISNVPTARKRLLTLAASDPNAVLRWVFLVPAGALLFLALMWMPSVMSEPSLDGSCALGLGHLLKAGARAGVDYVFTYGPLGYFYSPAYVEGLYAAKFAWEVAFAALTTLIVVRLAARIGSGVYRALLMVVAIVMLPANEARYFTVIVGAGLYLLARDRWPAYDVLLAAVGWAALALVKFTFLSVIFPVAALVAAGAPNWRNAAFLGASFAGCLLAFFLLAGQSLFDAPALVRGALQISGGYSEAMSVSGSARMLQKAEQIVVFLALATATLPAETWRSRKGRLGVIVLWIALGATWKGGFVRQDPFHVWNFFGYAALCGFGLAVVRAPARASRLHHVLASLALLGIALNFDTVRRKILGPNAGWVTLLGGTLGHNLHVLSGPRTHLSELRTAQAAVKKKYALPQIKKRVGSQPIDVGAYDQFMLLANDLNYHPRPVFQSYAAYTPTLARYNGEFFRSARAPRYVMTRWGTIDNRFPPQDDPQMLLELAWNYRPLFVEKDFLLLEKRPTVDANHRRGRVVFDRVIAFGEKVDVPWKPEDGLLTLSLDIDYKMNGALRRTLLRAPPVFLEVGYPRKQTRKYRIVPTLASVEFALNPFIEWNLDFIWLYYHKGEKRIRTIRLVDDRAQRRTYKNDVRVVMRLYTYPERWTMPHE